MNLDDCWNLVTIRGGKDQEEHLQTLEAELEKLPLHDLFDVACFVFEQMDSLHRGSLWRAAYLMCGGCSDDGFDYFKGWLLLQGKEVCARAVNEPDSLEQLPLGEDDFPACEEISDLAAQVYVGRTGRPFPRVIDPPPPIPPEDWGDFSNAEEMAKKLPRLWARYGEGGR